MTANSTPEPQGTAPWKSRPVFISSTFKDLQRERDWLSHSVFPRLREELAKRRHHLEPVNLRLGVEMVKEGTEEERELLVLKFCFDEIKRSRPNSFSVLSSRPRTSSACLKSKSNAAAERRISTCLAK